MKKRIAWEIALICVLGITGWYLSGIMQQIEANNPELKAIEDNKNLVFADGAGIDVMGNEIDSIFAAKPDGVERSVAAFLLRYNTLDADLEFWTEVNSHLSGLDTIRLTAYCENARCVETVRNKPDSARFTVLEYGGAVDMQAVIGADAIGEFWLRGNEFKKINWRDGNQTPFDIAMSIGLRQ